MCQTKAEGGKRCDYADAVANVRRKGIYQANKAGWIGETARKEAEQVVTEWKQQNSKLVEEHLPARQPFQRPGKSTPVPSELAALLTASKTPVTGFTAEERAEHLQAMHQEYTSWAVNMTEDEKGQVDSYTNTQYHSINQHLRRRINPGAKGDRPLQKLIGEMNQKRAVVLDGALKKAPQPEGPRRLFRFFKVPDGVTPNEYLKRYFETGEGFQEAGFMSTSADPEFVIAQMHKKNASDTNKNYIVMEILTQQGASLQKYEREVPGIVQSLEKEVLLPRNMKMRIVGTRKSQSFEFNADRQDLDEHFHYQKYDSVELYKEKGNYQEGSTMTFPMVQMIDEKLIRETAKRSN
jgi:hypothetical protein